MLLGSDRLAQLGNSIACLTGNNRQWCAENPQLLHYGLDMELRDDRDQPIYQWDKAAHRDFDALRCPPWDLAEQPARRGLFPHPPLASSVVGRVRRVLTYAPTELDEANYALLRAGIASRRSAAWEQVRCPVCAYGQPITQQRTCC